MKDKGTPREVIGEVGTSENLIVNRVRCPNCKGRDSSHWPFGPCTICKGVGKVTVDRTGEGFARRLIEP